MNENDWIHADMTGWNVLITGGNSGIGYAYARIAVNNNANVTIACRNENHARTACMVLNGLNEDNKVDYLIMDMAEPDKAHDAAIEYMKSHDRLNALVNNAGGVYRKDDENARMKTWNANYVSHVVLTMMLMPSVIAFGAWMHCEHVINSGEMRQIGFGSYHGTIAYSV